MQRSFALISIILINYNSSEYTISCVQSIQHAFLCKQDYRVYIVDNASRNSEKEKLEDLNKIQNVEILYSNENLGFAKANNLALKKIPENDIVWFLNNDTLINTELAKEITKYHLNNNEVLFFDMYDFDKKYCTNGQDSINLLFGNVTAQNKFLPFNIKYICGASLILRKTDTMPYWDEKFFLYYEDADYSLTLKKLGYNFIHLDKCFFQHKVFGSSTNSNNVNEIRQYSQIIFMKKWGKCYPLFLVFRTLYLLLNRNFNGLRIFYKCHKKYKTSSLLEN